ncbi:hypothetical protein F2Q70_00009210 [Brassica cretica]|uniref:Translation initiation factor IF-2, mitochondrial n=1 Tax=Brassica cretica TaxID=69181 RepID=A0A8S9LWN4_BRACR|nr:hypothetical protein F2Q70_00009210 [Brassica cretica]
MCLLRLKEPSVLLRCREEDLGLVESILDGAKEEYAGKANVHAPEVAVDTTIFLPPPPTSSDPHALHCSGGVVLASRDGKIVCENTLDARLDVAFRMKLPVIMSSKVRAMKEQPPSLIMSLPDDLIMGIVARVTHDRSYILHRQVNSNRLVLIPSLSPMEQFRIYVAVGSKIYEDKVADIMDGKIYVINLQGVKEIGNNVKREHTTEGLQILPRPPVVTVMGHVDHGKTSLLDALRNTSVAAREAGGITQHVGAFVVGMPESGTSITFLDTPGHAAFSEMRARGAAVTDIVVLVVAADDGVMPQTLEAIAHARSANVPIVVAINKCDKPGANPERVKNQLAAEGIELEDIGGNVQVVEVSAVKSTGLDKLEEALLLQAVDMDLMARVDGPAQAYVVEARLDKGRGPLATVIVKAGTLESGHHVVIGCQWGKLRAIRDMVGKPTERATPAMPVEIEGLKGVPMAGDDVIVVEPEKRAKMLSEGRTRKYERDRLLKAEEDRIAELEKREAESEEGVFRVELPIIVKSDVQGTAEAVSDALRTLNSPQVCILRGSPEFFRVI